MKPGNILILVGVLAAVVLGGCSLISAPPQAPPDVPTLTPQINTPSPTSLAVPSEDPTAIPSAPTPSFVAAFPDPLGYAWQPVATGLLRPVALTHAGDGSGRLFVVLQRGLIYLLEDGLLSEVPFLDIRDRVGSQANEQGLLGLAFHPQYAQNGLFYLNYTDLNGDTVIARFQVSSDPNLADPASELRLLQVAQPFGNHNGGGLVFGPDGYLYVALGDGGSGGDPLGNGQSLDSHLGKLLRIDVDGASPYAIPADNPFLAGEGLPEIWAYGFRNPWRFSFDAATGDLYVGDVGQNNWEEIDFLPAGSPGGANFGWNFLEGTHAYSGQVHPGLSLVDPIAEYEHAEGCSVTGGVVYRGQALSEWEGVYFYGDYCSGRIWGLLPDGQGGWLHALLFEIDANISSFGTDEDGELYLVDHQGTIYRLGK